jgi:alpha-L-rhamnosidase
MNTSFDPDWIGEGGANLKVQGLRIERLVSPRGIVVPDPEFTWELVSGVEGQRQTACEIEVVEATVDGKRRAVWHSQKMELLIGDEVLYRGEPLSSRGLYRWRVRVWDKDDQPTDWSDWTSFEMGVLAPDEISALWIGGGGVLRRECSVSGEVARARAYVSGLGYYEFYCNGTKVSDGALAPSFTDFEKRIEYEIIDLHPSLREGVNVFGFMLGDGWWRHWNQKKLQAIAEIIVEYADGRQEKIGTDLSWRATAGPVVQDPGEKNQQIFDGIMYDGRLLDPDWGLPGHDVAAWEPVILTTETKGELVPSLLPPMRITETLTTVKVDVLSPERAMVDFGQNFAGWVRARAYGPAGTTLVFRHAEMLHDDGTVNQDNLRGAKATDTFILRGEPKGETLEAHFTYHGFRYLQIDGPHACLDLKSITGCAVHSDLSSTMDFSTSDDQLNWLLRACRWTGRSNLYSVPTDCCQRSERRGWLMDGYLAMNSNMYFFEMEALSRKWFDDMASIQLEDGSLSSDAAPRFLGKSVGWQRVIALLPMKMYRQYGDLRFLDRAYPAMLRYAEYLRRRVGDGLLGAESIHSPEWLCIGHKQKELPDNALAFEVLQTVAEAAGILERNEDRERLEMAAKGLAERFHKKWYGGASLYGANTEIIDNGCYEGGTFFGQSNQVYPLRFGMVPPEKRGVVFDRLVDDLVHARGEGPFLTTGIGSTTHLMEVLSENGRDDLAWGLIQRKDYPGWGFMRRHGATTIWERWEFMTYFEMNAHNHAGLMGVAGWVFQYIAGLSVVPGSEPVFQLRPALHLPIESLNMTWYTRWGSVLVAWDQRADGTELMVEIPPGCRGDLRLPGEAEGTRLVSGQYRVVRSALPDGTGAR